MQMAHLVTAFIFSLIGSAAIMAGAILTGNGVLALFFGTPTAFIIDMALPDSFFYWLVPEGGGAAAILLLTLSAWLQLAALLTVGYYFWHRRSNSSVKRDAPKAARPLP